MGLLTEGLGDNTLLTEGLGGLTVVITQKILEGGGTLVYRKRVQGIIRDQQGKIIIQQTLVASSEMPLRLFVPIKLTHDTELKILEKLKAILNNPTKILVTVLKIQDSSHVSIKQRFIQKHMRPVDIMMEKIVNFVEKTVKIRENKLNLKGEKQKIINQFEIMDDIEKAELIDMIEKLEKEEDEG